MNEEQLRARIVQLEDALKEVLRRFPKSGLIPRDIFDARQTLAASDDSAASPPPAQSKICSDFNLFTCSPEALAAQRELTDEEIRHIWEFQSGGTVDRIRLVIAADRAQREGK